jgi:hypothetical protein
MIKKFSKIVPLVSAKLSADSSEPLPIRREDESKEYGG